PQHLAGFGVDARDGAAAAGGDEVARSVRGDVEPHRFRPLPLDADSTAATPRLGVDDVDGGALLGADEGALAVPGEGDRARSGGDGGSRQQLEGGGVDDVDLVVFLAGDVDRPAVGGDGHAL